MIEVVDTLNNFASNEAAQPSEQESCVILLKDEYQSLLDKIQHLESEIDNLHYRLADELREDRQRIATIEYFLCAKASKKEAVKISQIHAALKAQTNKALPFETICRQFSLTSYQLSKLVKHMDMRIFEVVRDPTRRKYKILRLRKRF